jgi:hypothetical protein
LLLKEFEFWKYGKHLTWVYQSSKLFGIARDKGSACHGFTLPQSFQQMGMCAWQNLQQMLKMGSWEQPWV